MTKIKSAFSFHIGFNYKDTLFWVILSTLTTARFRCSTQSLDGHDFPHYTCLERYDAYYCNRFPIDKENKLTGVMSKGQDDLG